MYFHNYFLRPGRHSLPSKRRHPLHGDAASSSDGADLFIGPHVLPAVQRNQRRHLLHQQHLPVRRLQHPAGHSHHHSGRGADHSYLHFVIAYRKSRQEDPLAPELYHYGHLFDRVGHILQVAGERRQCWHVWLAAIGLLGPVHRFLFLGLRADTLDDDVRAVRYRVPRNSYGYSRYNQLVSSLHSDAVLPVAEGHDRYLQLLLGLQRLHDSLRVLRFLPDTRDQREDRLSDSNHTWRETRVINTHTTILL